MFQLLHKYFVLNRKVALPGIGVFFIQRQPATLDFGKKAFVPPSSAIAFSQGVAEADTLFYSFISQQQRVEVPTAVRNFEDFTKDLVARLQADSRLELPGIGSLSRNALGTMQFKPVAQLPAFFPDAPVEKNAVKTVNNEAPSTPHHTIDVPTAEAAAYESEIVPAAKSTWWIYAIILAAVAIGAIFYYYVQNGSLQ